MRDLGAYHVRTRCPFAIVWSSTALVSLQYATHPFHRFQFHPYLQVSGIRIRYLVSCLVCPLIDVYHAGPVCIKYANAAELKCN